MINVTKTFLPPYEEYISILKRAWDKAWITNNGELALELEEKLKIYLGVKNILLYNNGTIVLQVALKVLDITGEVITTPFSYVATTTAILWEKCKPVFVDIDRETFCIDPAKIEAAITPFTQAILATHVYGYPCDVDAIEMIAKKYDLKVIYDAAHAFGSKINGRSLLDFGDISTCSFHATKVFHTGEGGCIVTNNEQWAKQLFLFRHFGHIGDEYFSMGTNGKNSELHAALGLCNLRYIENILQSRRTQWLYYKELLSSTHYETLEIAKNIQYNYSYFPVLFTSENDLLQVVELLRSKGINVRRYFYPALNTLKYVSYKSCPIAENIASRIICLPLFHNLEMKDQLMIINTILGKTI